jgi:hypothetical protein
MTQDYEALEPRTFMPAEMSRAYQLVAEFADIEMAEGARGALHDLGIPAEDIALLGPRGEEVDTRSGLSGETKVVFGDVTRWIIAGGVMGLVLVGVVGLLAGLIFGGDGDLWLGLITGGIFGAVAGSVIGGMAAAGYRARGRAVVRRHPELAHPMVGVHVDDAGLRDRAERVLREYRAMRIERHDTHQQHVST